MIRKIALYIPSVAVPILINILMVYFYAQYLQPGDYGTLNLYLNTINIIYAAALSFVQSAAFRFYSIKDYYESRKQYLSTFVFCNLLITVLLLVASYLVNAFVFGFDYMLVALSVGTNAMFQFYLNLYRLEGKNRGYVIIRVAASILILIVFLGLVIIKSEITYTKIIWITYGSYAVFVLIAIAFQNEKFDIHTVSFPMLKRAIQYGMPMMGVTLLGNIVSSGDQYALKFFLGNDAVGLYSLGYKISDMSIANITMLILLIATPAIMKEYDQKNKESSINRLSKILLVNNWIVLIVALEIIIYAGEIVAQIFPEYAGAENVIRLVAISAVLHSISLIICKPYELNKKTALLFILLVVTAIVNVVYNFIFIPIYGLDAAAHSSILAYLAYNILLYYMFKREKRMPFESGYYLKIVVSLLCTLGISIFLQGFWQITSPIVLVAQVFISCLVYVGVSFVFGIHKVLLAV